MFFNNWEAGLLQSKVLSPIAIFIWVQSNGFAFSRSDLGLVILLFRLTNLLSEQWVFGDWPFYEWARCPYGSHFVRLSMMLSKCFRLAHQPLFYMNGNSAEPKRTCGCQTLHIKSQHSFGGFSLIHSHVYISAANLQTQNHRIAQMEGAHKAIESSPLLNAGIHMAVQLSLECL